MYSSTTTNATSSSSNSDFKNGFLDGAFLKSKEIMGFSSSSGLFQSHHHQQQHQQQQGNNNGSLIRYRSAPSSYFSSLLDTNNNNNNNQNGRNGFSVEMGGGVVVGSYSVPIGVKIPQVQMRIDNNGGNKSNFIRQSSPPAGFFSGFDATREVREFRNGNGGTSSSTSGLNNHLNFSSGASSSTTFMPSILEDGSEPLGAGNQENVPLGNTNVNSIGYNASGFSIESWDDSAFASLKRNRDGDFKIFSDFNGLENQDGEPGNNTHSLTHHLSLPKTANEMAAVEKYLQFQQDSGVPCKIRAKRGCATHPRSIAERIRRIRISDRMNKLQELFPNMDKQTNKADMLNLAVEYIKDLQNQVQTLTETMAKCKCSSKSQQ